ncbi:hypothetical protein H5410_046442 [Solanum commersonii]|uniref:Uncharacterized protein n=1 Tax=Solanum commersonii TaxID=4109 RepID=A0A9J5XGH4_SOLCO|nr:hypothetical protein H5410_046442 [Solanum commersonii]
MATTQSLVGVASSSNIKCSSCRCKVNEQQHDYFIRRDKDDHYLVNYSKLGFKQLDFLVAFPKKKDWFYVMSQPNRCWTDEVNPCPLMF